jgi:hypothetical protein
VALSGILKGGLKTSGNLALPFNLFGGSSHAWDAGVPAPWMFRAPRVAIAAVETGELRPCLLNPATLKERYQINFDDLAPLGLDHEIGQYRNTASANIPIELAFDQVIVSKRWSQDNPQIEDWRGFLLQFTAAMEESSEFIGGAPPQMLLVWPNVLTIRAQVRSLEFSYQRFRADDLSCMTWTATMELKEVRTGFWSSGRLRSAAGMREQQAEGILGDGMDIEPQVVLV